MDKEQLKRIAERQCEKINKSHVFMAICSQNYIDDPICLMQLGLALLLDKPLFLIFHKDFKPPKNLIRALSGYEFAKDDDAQSYKEASERIVQKINNFLTSE